METEGGLDLSRGCHGLKRGFDLPFDGLVRELREERGLRQQDLATAPGLAQATIANYEKKLRFPDETTLGMLADYFDASMDFLLGRVDRLLGVGEDWSTGEAG